MVRFVMRFGLVCLFMSLFGCFSLMGFRLGVASCTGMCSFMDKVLNKQISILIARRNILPYKKRKNLHTYTHCNKTLQNKQKYIYIIKR